jgi:hypothetical protein
LDGVVSTEDFDRKFEFSDYRGPARLEEAEAALDLRPAPAKKAHFGVDRQMVWIAVIAVLVIVAVFLALRVSLF